MPNRAPSFPRYLNLLPHSGFWDTLKLELPHVRMLFYLDPPCLARTLFSIGEIMGDSFRINIYDNEYLPNFGFILYSDQKSTDETDVPEAVKDISKKELIKNLQQNGFINIRDEKSDNKRTFVDCLLNRNVDLERLYYLIRKSMPMPPSKRRTKQFLNVLSGTNTDKAKTLLTQKSITEIGLMNRFIFIKDNLSTTQDIYNLSADIIKSAKSVSQKISEFSFKATLNDINCIDRLCNHVSSELTACKFIKKDIHSLTNLYRSTIIKISFIIAFLKKAALFTHPGDAWNLADVLTRILINEKICILEKISKNKKLYGDLLNFIKTKQTITLREMKRKFQYADKPVFNFYINYLCGLGILSDRILPENKRKKLPQLFHVNSKNICTGDIHQDLYPPSITK